MENSLFRATAIWAGISFAAGIVIVYVILFTSDYMEGPEQRARAFTSVLGFLLAALTFLTVMWRGMISTRQAHEDKRQNDSKDEADLGLLLEKGYEHTARGKAKDIALGIAMLDTVALAENDKYASYALHEIIRQLEPCFLMGSRDKEHIFSLIKGVFVRLANDEKKCHRRPPTVVRLDFSTKEGLTKTNIEIFPQMPACIVSGGSLRVGPEEAAFLGEETCRVQFAYCAINPKSQRGSGGLGGLGGVRNFIGRVSGAQFHNCTISDFEIGKIGDSKAHFFDPPKVTFGSCNLSETEFASRDVFAKSTFVDCYFAESAPPRIRTPNGFDNISLETLEANCIFPWQRLITS